MKQYVARMQRKFGVKDGPYEIKDTVYASSKQEAEKILESRHSNRKVYLIREVAPEAVQSRKERRPSSGGEGVIEQLKATGFGVLLIGAIAILFLAIYGAISLFGDGAPTAGVQQEVIAPESSVTPGNLGSAPAADDEHGTESLQHEALNRSLQEHAQSSGTLVPDQEIEYVATIVDRRDSIVLQSGPKMMISKNVARLPTGTVVTAGGKDGEWIHVRTEDGLSGYVRRRQLKFDTDSD